MTSQNQQSKELAERQTERMDLDLSQGAFSSVDHFKQAYNMAKYLCHSSMVPKQYQGDNNIGNCIIALEMAQRMGASPFAVMQNLDVIHGNPSWRSQFVIASLNSCGRFSPIRYEMEDLGEKTVEYTWTDRNKNKHQDSVTIYDKYCRAWAYDKATGERLYGPPITIEMAVQEGWYTKTDSKWKTIPELMLRYRAAKWFGNLYAPDITMGMHDDTEVRDIIDVKPGQNQEEPKSGAADLNDQILNGDPGHTEPQGGSEDTPPEQGTEQPAEEPTEGAQAESSVIECPNQDERPISKQYCNETCQSREGCPAWE